MANDFKGQFNVKESKVTEHHGLSMSAIKRNHCSISKIKAAIMCHGNPFAVKGPMLYNLITHAYIPEKYVPHILNMDDSGHKLYEDYVAGRINGNVSLWAPVKKQKQQDVQICMCCILFQGHSDHEHSRTAMAPLL